MEESLDIHIPWPGWHAVRRLGRGSYGSVWEIEREVAGKPERCALKVVGVPPEGGYDDSLDMGYDGVRAELAYWAQAHPQMAVIGMADPDGNHVAPAGGTSPAGAYLYEKSGRCVMRILRDTMSSSAWNCWNHCPHGHGVAASFRWMLPTLATTSPAL